MGIYYGRRGWRKHRLPRLTDIKTVRCPHRVHEELLLLLLASSIFPVCTIFCFWVFFGSCFISRSTVASRTNFRYPATHRDHQTPAVEEGKAQEKNTTNMFGRGRKQSVSQASTKSVKPPPTASVRDSGVSKRRPSVASTRRRPSIATSTNTLVDPSVRWVTHTPSD